MTSLTSSPKSHFLFSGGEVHLKLNGWTFGKSQSLVCTDYTMNGFMALAECVEVFRRQGVEKIELIYPYLPYARQDRVMERFEPFSLKVFCNLLNSLNLDSVVVFDPHSDVGPALINNCRAIPQWEIANDVIPQGILDDQRIIYVSPDAGAYKKTHKLALDDSRICMGAKMRNGRGEIVSTKVYSPVDLTGRDCLIVDDICDGGRTFIELSKALKKEGAARVMLYVTHGIFAKGFDELRQHIDHIYTTDSFPHDPIPDFLTIGALNYEKY